jgi:hypothetical protein
VALKDLQKTLKDSIPQLTQQIQEIYTWCAGKKNWSARKLLQVHGFSFCDEGTSNPRLLFVLP